MKLFQLDQAQSRRLFDLPATAGELVYPTNETAEQLKVAESARVREHLDELSARNAQWFETEMDKLDRWAEDRRASLRAELAELDAAIRDVRRSARLPPNLPEKLRRERDLRNLETKRDEAWHNYDAARSTSRRMNSWTRLAEDWSSKSSGTSCLPSAGNSCDSQSHGGR